MLGQLRCPRVFFFFNSFVSFIHGWLSCRIRFCWTAVCSQPAIFLRSVRKGECWAQEMSTAAPKDGNKAKDIIVFRRLEAQCVTSSAVVRIVKQRVCLLFQFVNENARTLLLDADHQLHRHRHFAPGEQQFQPVKLSDC